MTATVGAKTAWGVIIFLLILAGAEAVMLLVLIDSWGTMTLGEKLGLLFFIWATGFLSYKVGRGIFILGGVLTLDGDQLTWKIRNNVTSIDMNDVYSIDIIEGDLSFFVLKDSLGGDLIRFSASLDNGGGNLYKELYTHINDAPHNKELDTDRDGLS